MTHLRDNEYEHCGQKIHCWCGKGWFFKFLPYERGKEKPLYGPFETREIALNEAGRMIVNKQVSS